jgi:protein-arginine kinase activator protein McsA
MTIEELEDYLEELIKQENYEEASKIRDEIKRIKEEGY